jgi:hypothetical protein
VAQGTVTGSAAFGVQSEGLSRLDELRYDTPAGYAGAFSLEQVDGAIDGAARVEQKIGSGRRGTRAWFSEQGGHGDTSWGLGMHKWQRTG